MKISRTLTVIIGIMQIMIAVLTVIIACGLYFNFFSVQTLLNAAAEFSYFHLLALLALGFLSIINGLLLVQKWLESR